jgi:deoxycytidine triphosphate deaminase
MANNSHGVLAASELVKRMKAGELIRNVRLKEGEPDVQPASYDLAAGRAVWTDTKTGKRTELLYSPGMPETPYVILEPGQMMSVITREEIAMPKDLCGTVFSKNRLALNGIFAFNAGHVDPGFEGPIVIRLINLRRIPYTVNLGERIFTIVFQTLADGDSPADLQARPKVTMDDTVIQVRNFADFALSNALFDLYGDNITRRLEDHRTEILNKLRVDLGKEFVRQDNFGTFLFKWGWKLLFLILSVVGLTVAIVKNWGDIIAKSHPH